MKKVGFIDYYLDEWHANNYPKMIKELSEGRYEAVYAYGMTDNPNGITNEEWSEKHNIELCDTIEEVVEKSDVLIVLSPDNPEMHEELCSLPLASGKLCYVDKTFAPDRAAAERIFEHAKKHNTKCFSSSALRFASELKDVNKGAIHRIYSEGPGTYDMYSIHQIEPIVCLMESRAEAVMFTGEKSHPSMIIKFKDGRYAQMYQTALGFRIITADNENMAEEIKIESNYFALFISAMIEFFDTGKAPVTPEQTIDVIAIREAGLKAMEKPFEWILV